MRLRVPDFIGLFKRRPKLSPRTIGVAARFLVHPWFLSAVFALLAAFLISAAAEGFLIGALSSAQANLAKTVSGRGASLSRLQENKLRGGEMSFVPFNVSEKTAAANASEPQKTIGDITLRGTLPDIGAWLSSGGETALVLKDQEYDNYKLDLITTGRVLLAKDDESFPLYLELSGKTPAAPQARQPATPQRINAASDSGIVRASETGRGSIKRELIDGLLMNPYDEIRKINLTADSEGKGMRLVRMLDNSFLGQLGMQVGDILTGVNGNAIINMANLNNAISSMLNSNEFSLEFTRNGKPIRLGYSIQ